MVPLTLLSSTRRHSCPQASLQPFTGPQFFPQAQRKVLTPGTRRLQRWVRALHYQGACVDVRVWEGKGFGKGWTKKTWRGHGEASGNGCPLLLQGVSKEAPNLTLPSTNPTVPNICLFTGPFTVSPPLGSFACLTPWVHSHMLPPNSFACLTPIGALTCLTPHWPIPKSPLTLFICMCDSHWCIHIAYPLFICMSGSHWCTHMFDFSLAHSQVSFILQSFAYLLTIGPFPLLTHPGLPHFWKAYSAHPSPPLSNDSLKRAGDCTLTE